MDAILYVHGKNGSADESNHFKKLFPNCEVTGLDYKKFTPWEAGEEINRAVSSLKERYGEITLIANSIGAFFCMNADIAKMIKRAFFISPIVDMEKLILDMMVWSNVSEKELKEKGVVKTSFGEDLSWEYLCYVRGHKIKWKVPTEILYGENDELTSFDTVFKFAKESGARLKVMPDGEHWFHTEEQMRFLDEWIKDAVFEVRPLKECETEKALSLAWKVFTEYESPDYAPEGTEEFKKTLMDENYLSGIVYYGAFFQEELIGVLGIRKEKRSTETLRRG